MRFTRQSQSCTAGSRLLVHAAIKDRLLDALLRRFAFIPYARLDDLMVSYAAPGGGEVDRLHRAERD